MSQTTQQNADLSQDAYHTYPVGIRPPGTTDTIDLEGTRYSILEHQSNPRTGYQGTIYQRVDTGDIVVAHRGTEIDQGIGPLVKDALWTDGRMVASRLNPQAQEAIELTRHAIEFANREARIPGRRIPEVTVTGHSLGGTLAQIGAHHFGLKGETFNAYGAASLGLGIPRGGDDMINHVMASDFVSAASPQYGQVRLHASPKEVATLVGAGYDNDDRFVADVRSPGIAHAALLGTHGIHNFTNVDGDGRPDRSILADPDARQRAEQYAPMFAKFRDEMSLARGAATAVTTHLTPGLVGYDSDRVQPTTPAGAPGRREGVQLLEPVIVPPLPAHLDDGSRMPSPAPAPRPAPARDAPQPDAPGRMTYPPIPEYLRDADRTSRLDSARPSPGQAIERLAPDDRKVFEQTLRIAQQAGLPPEQAQNAAMALAATAKADPLMQHADRMAEADGRVFASYHPHGDREPIFHASVDLKQAGGVPIEDSLQQIARTQEQQLVAQQTPTQPGPSPDDPATRGPTRAL